MEDRNVAANVLHRAAQIVTTERGTQHGDAESSFAMIADMWSVMITHMVYRRTGVVFNPALMPADVAEMMSILKKCRKVYGNTVDPDHAIDDVGYTALAAMINAAKTTQEQE